MKKRYNLIYYFPQFLGFSILFLLLTENPLIVNLFQTNTTDMIVTLFLSFIIASLLRKYIKKKEGK
ncbi:MAG: hypothetical protein ACFFAH_03585 [Promethearchaeota archaeon]